MPGSEPVGSITIVAVPRERFSVAPRSLRSLLANTARPYQLIYVDAGSPPHIRDEIASAARQHGFAVLRTDHYLSPNQARNLGLAEATGELVVFVDNDVLFMPGWLPALVEHARETGAALVSPLIQIGEPRDGLIHFAGGDLTIDEPANPKRLSESHRLSGRRIADMSDALQPAPCDYGEFHCVLLRHSILKRLGPFDEALLSVTEHVDLGLALREIGARARFEPRSRVLYYDGGPFTLADAAYASLRWSDEWNRRSFEHFVQKWGFDPSSIFYVRLASFLRGRQRRACLPMRPASDIPADRPLAQTANQLFNELHALGHGTGERVHVRNAYDVAAALFAGTTRPCGKPYIAQAVGVASVLARFGARCDAIAAGLLHGAYTHGQFPIDAGLTHPARRSWLRQRIGSASEGIVDAYARIRFSGEDGAITERELDALPLEIALVAMIRVANEIEARLANAPRHGGKATLPLPAAERLIEPVLGRLGAGGMLALLKQLSEDHNQGLVEPVPQHPVPSSCARDRQSEGKTLMPIRAGGQSPRLWSAIDPLVAIPRDAELVGIAVVKNECDIIEAFVRYNLRVLDGLAIIDHASSDNTVAILRRLSDEGLPIAVIEHEGAMQTQAQCMNTLLGLVRATLSPRFVLPLDADEFLRVAGRSSLRAALSNCPAGKTPILPWITYMPTAADDPTQMDPLRRIRHRRAREPVQYYKAVLTAAQLTDERCQVADGNHLVLGPDEQPLPTVAVDGVALAHFPVRLADQIRAKLCVARMALRVSPNRERGQSAGWEKMYSQMATAKLDTRAGLQAFAASYYADEAVEPVLDPLPDIPYDQLSYADMISVDGMGCVVDCFDALACSFASPELADSQRLSAELAKLHRSTSWRMTAPLRWAITGLRQAWPRTTRGATGAKRDR